MAKENPRYQGVLLDENGKPIEGSDFKDWKSRSVAVVCSVISKTMDGEWQFLVERRGPGCPDNIGKLVMACGYVGWDETLREAAVRELFEETGLKVDPERLRFAGVNDSTRENRQNITMRFVVELSDNVLFTHIQHADLHSDIRGGESGEVDELLLIPLSYALENKGEFAFGHADVMKEIVDNFSKIKDGGYYKDSIDRENEKAILGLH